MDKPNFLEQAPAFYAVAIACCFIESKREVSTLGQIKGGAPVLTSALLKDDLMEAALRLLISADVVSVVKMAFGPPLYQRLPNLNTDWLYTGAGQFYPAFAAFAHVKNYDWLRAALADVNQHYDALLIAPADFSDAAPSLWEPLPLERNDERQIEAAKAVDEAIAKIEADNGYAANVPGERDYVIQSLKTFSTTLKESAQTTAMQVKTFALDPLALVAKRFAGAALELAAGAAKEAILAWLKAKFGALLAALLS